MQRLSDLTIKEKNTIKTNKRGSMISFNDGVPVLLVLRLINGSFGDKTWNEKLRSEGIINDFRIF